MTVDEAYKMQRDILKESIRARLYKYNPEKYKHFKPSKRYISPDEILEIADMVRTIADHERGYKLFEMPDTFFSKLNRR